MATDIRSRRMLKERMALEKETTAYACFFNDDDMFNFFCYLVSPDDSVYRHKLIKLQFEIPPRYPLVPPKVKFVQHRGQRIHPNLYIDGKVCLSILGTWSGEPWAISMTTDSVLRTIQSLLDNHPYLHEPRQKDHPEFNEFVRYSTWQWLLLDYLVNETHPAAKAWLQTYLVENGAIMTSELHRQQALATQRSQRVFNSPYKHAEITADYPGLLRDLSNALKASNTANVAAVSVPGSAPRHSGLDMAGLALPGPNFPKAVGSGNPQDELSVCGAQPKRKLYAKGAIDASQAQSHLYTLEAQQAKVQPQQTGGPKQATTTSAALTLDEQSCLEPPQKRTKKDFEVIDLT